MASVWKRPDSKYWIACYTDVHGRQLKRSTRTVDRKQAVKLAEEYEAAACRHRTARKAREVISALHRDLTGEDLVEMSTRNFFHGWLERKRPETAASTIAFYKKAVSKFLIFLGADAERPVEEITSDHVTRFRNEEAKTLASKTVNHDLKCLKMAFKAARRDGVITENPTEFVETVRKTVSTVNHRAFTVPELQSILAIADDEWCSLIRFGLYTGQRLGDLAAITWSSVDLARGEIRMVTRKTGRRMIITIAAGLRVHLEAIAAPDVTDTPLHPKASGILHRQGKSGSLSNQFADLLAQAGLREKKSHKTTANSQGRGGRRERNRLSFHSLRRTATTLLHEAGVPSAVAQELIGHDSEEMHQLYVKVGREAMEKATKSFPIL